MLRTFLTHALPFLVPFALYGIWLAASRRKAQAAGQGAAPLWREAPWIWLAASGLVLVILSFITVAMFTGAEPGGTYVPPRYIGGEVAPAETR